MRVLVIIVRKLRKRWGKSKIESYNQYGTLIFKINTCDTVLWKLFCGVLFWCIQYTSKNRRHPVIMYYCLWSIEKKYSFQFTHPRYLFVYLFTLFYIIIICFWIIFQTSVGNRCIYIITLRCSKSNKQTTKTETIKDGANTLAQESS